MYNDCISGSQAYSFIGQNWLNVSCNIDCMVNISILCPICLLLVLATYETTYTPIVAMRYNCFKLYLSLAHRGLLLQSLIETIGMRLGLKSLRETYLVIELFVDIAHKILNLGLLNHGGVFILHLDLTWLFRTIDRNGLIVRLIILS